MITRQCERCQTSFDVPYPSSRRVLCSAKCRAGAKRKARSDTGVRRTVWVEKLCPCGNTFEVPRWGAVENKSQVYCSPACREQYRKPIKGRPAAVKHRRRVTEEGYVRVYVEPGKRPPGSTKSHLLEHRVVMAETLGRHLLPDENVHHINGDKTDNRPENLELWITKQPKGQRPDDLLKFAYEIIERYGKIEQPAP